MKARYLTFVICAVGGLSAVLQITPLRPVVHAGNGRRSRTGAVKSSAPASNESEQLAWSILTDAAEQADSGTLGTAGPRQWRSTCDLIKRACPSTTSALPLTAFVHHMAASQDGINPIPSTLRGDTVFFNKIAQPAVMQCDNTDCASGISFPVGSIIGRFAWLRIKSNSCPTFMAFDPARDVPTYNASKSVMIDTTNSCKADSRTMVVPLRHFFSVPISELNLPSFTTPHGVTLQTGDIAVVLGFHLIKKVKEATGQNNGWVWATFWWSSDPGISASSGDTGYPCSAPSRCPHNPNNLHEWSNYVMNVTSEPAGQEAFAPISNPYVDSPPKLRANCIVCHSFAMRPNATNAGYSGALTCGAQSATSINEDSLLNATGTYAESCNPHRVRTDSIWTIAANIPIPANAPIPQCSVKLCPMGQTIGVSSVSRDALNNSLSEAFKR